MRNCDGGTRWDILIFWRTIPVHTICYIFSVAWLVAATLHYQSDLKELYKIALIFLLSISGIIWGRLTKGPQVIQAYYPVFLGMLFLMGHAAFTFENFLNDSVIFWWIMGGVVLLSMVSNLTRVLGDIWPAKMAVTRLKNDLDKMNISSFYTYKTPFNAPFVDMLMYHSPEKYKIQYLERLEDVSEGYIVVPPTGAVSIHFESLTEVIDNGDFNSDSKLLKLINTKDILKYAVTSFKTFGSSKYWIHLSDDLSYRDILLGDVSDYDRWRGLGWILDARKLQPLTNHKTSK